VPPKARFVARRWEGDAALPTFTSNASPMRQFTKEPTMAADNLFSAVLTFSLLAAGTIAVGSEMVAPRQAAKTSAVALLPTVTVVGKRAPVAVAEAVTLPTVVVTGHRPVVTAAANADTSRDSRVE